MLRYPLSFLVLLGACSTPDVSSPVTEARALLSTSAGALRPALLATAAQEDRRSEQTLIDHGKTVYTLSNCAPTDAFGLTSKCAVKSAVDLSNRAGTANMALAGLEALEGYFTSLQALATADSSDAVQQQADALVAALKEAEAAKFQPLASMAAGNALRAEKGAKLSGFLANQIRVFRMRQIVRLADPEIQTILKTVAARSEVQSSLQAKRAALETARAQTDAAQDSGDPVRYRKALDDLKKAHAIFAKAQDASSANGFRLLSKMHGQLLQRLEEPRDTSEILATVTEMRSVLDTLKRKEE